MPFDWKQFINLASFLQNVNPSGFCQEAAQRTAVTRTYFAAYGHATDYAILKYRFMPNLDPKKKHEDHGRLRECYTNNNRGKIAFQLTTLRENRNKCDYDDHINDLPKIVKISISQAQDIFSKLN